MRVILLAAVGAVGAGLMLVLALVLALAPSSDAGPDLCPAPGSTPRDVTASRWYVPGTQQLAHAAAIIDAGTAMGVPAARRSSPSRPLCRNPSC